MNEIKTLKDLVYYADATFQDELFSREIVKKEFQDRSFHQFRIDADALGVWLQEQFPAQRVHAALVGTTSYAYLTAWFGIQCGNHVSVPLDAANSIEKISDEINRSDSVIVFLDDKHAKNLENFKILCPAVKYFIRLSDLPELIASYLGQIPSGTPEASDLAAILFTSGTTGLSKGVMLSHGNLIDNATCEPDHHYRGTKRMTVLPIHHVFCFTCDILCAFWYGRAICINDSMMRIVRNLKLFQPHSVTFVPMIAASVLKRMNQMAETNPDELAVGKEVFGENFDIIYTGGAYLSPEIIHGYQEFGIEIAQGYGMTECSPRICTGVKGCPHPESVGRIVDRCQVRITDESEIWVKSPSVMMGYYHNPEETAKSLTPDGWLRTGDLGYQDEDGYLYITGRKKNLIILSNGENVSPEEIENQFAYFAPVKEIVVYALDGAIAAEVFPDSDYESENIQDEIQAKIDEINLKFPPAKRIVRLILRETEFPKTASRKIIRDKIHEN